MKRSLFPLIGLLFAGCGRLQTIPWPGKTPENWCQGHPCVPVDLGFVKFILSEPTSSLLIYGLGILTVAIGIYMIRTRGGERSRLWFGLALLFWGVAALSAGTSYQAFSYEIKCAGREVCAWTSWWEIYYYMLQAFSMNSFLVAIGISSARGMLRKGIFAYALLNVIAYNVILFTGAFIPNKFMVSFELMVLFTGPNFLILLVINTLNYIKTRELLELRLILLWLFQGLVITAYYTYLLLGYTEKLWERGIWFSANDVLHGGLILWMLYIIFFVAGKVRDNPRGS